MPALVPELDVTSLQASLDFYVGILGFTVKYSRPEEAFAYLELGDAHLMLEEAAGPGRRFHTGLQRPFGQGLNIQLEVPDAAALYQKAVAAGHTIILPLEEKSYRVNDAEVRQQQFVVACPDGYLIRPFTGTPSAPLIGLLSAFQPFDELEVAHVHQLQQFLADSTNPYDRSNRVAHVVADAFVVNPERTHVLMVLHGENGHWMSPGGHMDGHPDAYAAALRELFEETGITAAQCKPLLNGGLFDLNVGYIPARSYGSELAPGHLHFDTCFAFETSMSHPLTISHESKDIGWKPIEEAMALTIEGHRRRGLKILEGVIG